MKYLCLIYLDEEQLNAIPPKAMSDLNAAHLDYNDALRKTGHFLVAEALDPPKAARSVRVRQGKASVTDGPFTEAKEFVAGFYLLEAGSLDEAVAMAAKIPSAELGTIEVRPARPLIVEGRELRWG